MEKNIKNSDRLGRELLDLIQNSEVSDKKVMQLVDNPLTNIQYTSEEEGYMISAFSMAVYCDRHVIATSILKRKDYDPNKRDAFGYTDLMNLVESDDDYYYFIFKLTENEKTDVNGVYRSGRTILMDCIMEGKDSLVLRLLESPTLNLTLKDRLGRTALDYAKKYQCPFTYMLER